MAAHRYWRALGLESYGFAGLEISEFQLFSIETRVDEAAGLTSSIAPISGSLSNLKDNSVSTGAAWSAGDLRALVLSWDFGSGGAADVTDIRLGSTAAPVDKFLLIVRLQWSDDGGVWTDLRAFLGISYPGRSALTASSSFSSGDGGWNPLDKHASVSVSGSGNEVASDGSNSAIRAVQGRSAGRYQFEVTTTATATDSYYIGVGTNAASLDSGPGTTGGANSWGLRWSGIRWFNGGELGGPLGALAIGDVVGVVVDFSGGTISFYRNGALLGGGPAFTGVGGTLYPMVGGGGSGTGWVSSLTVDLLAFPVAGAEPWLTLTPQILVNRVRGRAADVAGLAIPTAASVARPFAVSIHEIGRARKDFVLGGYGQSIGRVRGFTLDYVNPLNKPYRCRVRLIREIDGMVVREVWSAADGAYDFQYLDELQSYTVIAYYLDHGKRAVVSDGLSLANGKVELMA